MKKNEKKVNIVKESYLLFIDTETIGSLQVPNSCLPFEVGAKVYDVQNKKVVYEKSFIVKKFFDNKYIMLSTFSALKYPGYFQKLDTDKRYKKCNVSEISKDIEKIIKKYHINIMVAHNAEFDYMALERLFNEFNCKNPFEKLDYLDTQELSTIITYSKDYANYCLANKEIISKDTKESCFITNSGRVRITAQALYSYLVKNPHFQEAHTGLEDIEIEIVIFEESLNRLGNTMVMLNHKPRWTDFSQVCSM